MSALEKAIGDLPLLNEALRTTDEDTYEKIAASIVAKVGKLSPQDLASKDVLQVGSFGSSVDNADRVQNLPTGAHTIAYVLAVSTAIDQITSSGKAAPRQLPQSLLPEGNLWPFITQALLQFNPYQVRYVGQDFSKIITVVVRGAEQTTNYIPAVQLLNHVILRLDPTSSTFTSTHHSYIRLCLFARAFDEAINILDRPIYHIPAVLDKQSQARSYDHLCSDHDISATYLTPNTGLTFKITSKGYLEYYLWGALCYMAVGQHKKAITFLEIVILAPAQQQTASAVQIESYKKWVLLNLLVHGEVKPIRGGQSTTLRTIRAVAKPYDCIAEAFKSRDPRRLSQEIDEGGDIWRNDTNEGLLLQVYHAHVLFAVKSLSKTYVALPISEVVRQVSPKSGLQETATFIQELITSGKLKAGLTPSADRQDQILRFLPDSADVLPEAQIQQQLALKAAQLQLLLKNITDIEHRTELSKEYVEYLRKLKKQRDEDTKKSEGGKPRTASIDDFDEDVMDEF